MLRLCRARGAARLIAVMGAEHDVGQKPERLAAPRGSVETAGKLRGFEEELAEHPVGGPVRAARRGEERLERLVGDEFGFRIDRLAERLDGDAPEERLLRRGRVHGDHGAGAVEERRELAAAEESHLSIHTWPEHGYVAVDVYTCGDCEPERARDVLSDGLAASSTEWMLIERGIGEAAGDIRIAAYDQETAAPARRSARA